MKVGSVLFLVILFAGGCAASMERHDCPTFKEHTEVARALLDKVNRLRSERGLKPLEHDHRLCLVAYCYGELLNSRRQYEWGMGKNLQKSIEWLRLHGIEFEEVFEGGGYLPIELEPEEVVSKTRLEQALSGDWSRVGLARHG